MPNRPTVAVIGGGITGLAAAWFLRAGGAEVTVYEASSRLGGKVDSIEFAGRQVDTGPDCFLARVPWAIQLCQQLGLGDELVAPATRRAYVWTRGRLRALPEGLVLGVPSRLGPLARSGIVSRAGVARAALDLVAPRRTSKADRSVADAVGARLGHEVVDRLVEPLLGGIHAGRADELSLEANAPAVADAMRAHRSLLRATAAMPAPSDDPVFLVPRGGAWRLVDRLADSLGDSIKLGATVGQLSDVDAERIVVTTPAPVTAALLRPLCPDAAAELERVRHASVGIVTLAYPRRDDLDGSGFLVSRVDGRLLTACTWLSSKWEHYADDRVTLLRASVGRSGDDRALHMTDHDLAGAVHEELVAAMGPSEQPLDAHVARWTDAFPQYDVGHLQRVERIEAAVAAVPHVRLAGAAYRGVGLAACIRSAELAASGKDLGHG